MYQNSPSIKGQWIQSKSEHLTKHSWPSNNNYIHYVLKSKFDYCDSFLAFCASTKPPFDSSSTTRLLWIWRLAQAICSKNSSRFQKEFPSEFLKKKALKLFRNPSKILPSAPLRKFWIGKLKNTKYQCHQCPLYQFAAFHLWYCSTFPVRILSENQTAEKLFKYCNQNPAHKIKSLTIVLKKFSKSTFG